MTDLFVVWSTTSLLTAVFGGFALGFALTGRFDNPRFTALESIAVVFVLTSFAGLVFYAGQAVDTYASEGLDFAWRVVSRFGLWMLFAISMAVGTGCSVRIQRGNWRT